MTQQRPLFPLALGFDHPYQRPVTRRDEPRELKTFLGIYTFELLTQIN